MPQNLFFFPYIFLLSFLFLCTSVYLFFFFFSFFPYLFLFFFFCVCIFSNFSVLSFNSHKLFFWKMSIRITKPKRNHFGINLYLSFCSYFMGLFIFVFLCSCASAVFTEIYSHLYRIFPNILCQSDSFWALLNV